MDQSTVHEHYPSQDTKLVSEMVGASHARIDRVKELLAQSPSLANAAWDWGFGDWETALGACSHTGSRDIAEVLIAHGARPDVFTFAMLGNLPAVRAIVAARPGVQKIAGPHGISLLSHARAGGDEAKEVLEFLESLGDADPKPTSLEVDDAGKAALSGLYVFGPGPQDRFEVATNNQNQLVLKRGARSIRILRVGENEFAPVGAPSVRIRFSTEDDQAKTLTVHDPSPTVVGHRA